MMEAQASVTSANPPDLSLNSTRRTEGVDTYTSPQPLTVIDRAAVFAVLTNTASLILGPVTAFLVATHFDPELQGFYYTFGSLTALQFLMELGLGQALIQFASHEWSNLRIDGNGRVIGDPDSLLRLISLSRLALIWYGVSAALVIVVLGPTGYFFFSRSSTSNIQWMWPWLALCVGIGFNILLSPMFYLLQGCNHVAQFWFYRTIQQVVNGLSIWAAILLGAELWTLPIAIIFGLLWSVAFLWRQPQGFFILLRSSPAWPRISWLREVWPVQWRIAVGWMSAHLTPLLFPPVLFLLSGPVAAGQMGLTATLCSVLLAISCNWVVTKASRFGVLVARKQFVELDRLFLKSFLVSLAVAFCGAATILGITYLLYDFHHMLASRILRPLPTGLLLLATVLNSATVNLSVYLQARKKDSLVAAFLTTSIVTFMLVDLLYDHFGIVGITAGYLGVIAIIQFPAALFIFLHYHERHSRA